MTPDSSCMTRRRALVLGGSAIAVLAVHGTGATAQQLVKSDYPRKTIAHLNGLEPGKVLTFTYPNEEIENILVALGEEAGGGIGAGRNIVAFNTICPHMGGYLDASTYNPSHSSLGPCPLHLTTFDLSRHGMVISGHATESLPQIVLELEGDAIVATGVMGLFYGYSQNPRGT